MKWNLPTVNPDVSLGDEKEFWIAIYSERTNKEHVFIAQYQNRPFDEESDDYLEDYVLHTPDGDPIDSVGWVTCKEHSDFDNFYEPITFNEQYRLLGWAEYEPPKFTGLNQ